jgi:general secretion pathway protein A
MYKKLFGFKERPFRLVPDPAYLFLSRTHELALAHLNYAVIQGDGFVEITGEVGTGKTTLCRAFLEDLDNNTKAAYIFNPNLNSVQLLKAINDEFKIRSDADNTKDLIDTLNAFLIEKKSQGKNVVLLIDEAQNLTKEVLEQLRLISNLETAKNKLLQIILVGQPELGEKLDSHELRQLGQRISLSCRLFPLNSKEVKEYIKHRINIASRGPRIKFARAAYRSIYRYSQGIPRLINIVCDRSLLTAFGLNKQRITRKIARASIRELAGRGDINRYGLQKGKKAILLFSVLCVAFFMVILFRPGFLDVNAIFNPSKNKKSDISPSDHVKTAVLTPPATDSEIIRRPEAKESESVVETVKNPDKTSESVAESVENSEGVAPVPNLGDFLGKINGPSSRHMALEAVMDLWKTESGIKPYLNDVEDDRTFFRLAAKQNGLLIHRVQSHLNLIKKLNLPSILAFYLPGKVSPVYLTLSKTDARIIALRGGDEVIAVKPSDLETYWSGVAYIPWKNFFSLTGTIPLNSPNDSIITLKMLLQDIGFNEVEISPDYDEQTQQAVKEIQKKHGIKVDALVGPLTKMVLYNEKKSLGIPHITP